MKSFYTQSLCETLQQIAREDTEEPRPLEPKDIEKSFSAKTITVPSGANSFIKKHREYRERVAKANYGTY